MGALRRSDRCSVRSAPSDSNSGHARAARPTLPRCGPAAAAEQSRPVFLSRLPWGSAALQPHSFHVRSIAAVAKYLPSSEMSAHMTRPSCPSIVLSSEKSRIDHSLTLLSYELERTNSPWLGSKRTCEMSEECAGMV
eukprot:CAMPEP_0182842700 /NCGR_PEP_ID=MMETSP0006_2-20121128/25776_1 /TAXON_ID=97485 /ORGANISM="Prymnesium parvum, Strain Texoma1" /LENGTH=136 /DNA_ID=CAMNT_0024972407 /DNA_START=298 /DNA_END=709 /DNA_ORIENTATION=-